MLNRATGVYIHKCLPWTACSCEGGIRGRLTHALEEEGCAGESLLVSKLKEQTAGGSLESVMEFTSPSLDAGCSYSDDFNYSSSCWTASAGNQMFFVLAGKPLIQFLLSACSSLSPSHLLH